jgi:heme oxygenase
MFHPDLRTPLPHVLKSATEKNHLDLEAALAPQWGRMDAAGYAALLRVFYGFYAPLEGSIARELPQAALPDLKERRKAEWLLSDLRALGHNDVPAWSAQLPTINNPGAAWGALYVLEGSTLGGRHICKLVRKTLPDAPLRFFSGYAEETGPRWLRFQEALRSWGDAHETQTVIDAANQTFEKFRLWINQSL